MNEKIEQPKSKEVLSPEEAGQIRQKTIQLGGNSHDPADLALGLEEMEQVLIFSKIPI